MLYTLFRSTLLTSSVAVAAVFMASTAAFANPSATTGSITITGTVASTIAITADEFNTNVDLSPTGLTPRELKVAKLTFGTNNSTGLTVKATGIFTLIATETSVDFRVGINDETANLNGKPSFYKRTNEFPFVTGVATPVNSPYSLYIRYLTNDFQNPGTYTATINLTVTDK